MDVFTEFSDMKDIGVYEALFITLPIVFIVLAILLLVYSQNRRKVRRAQYTLKNSTKQVSTITKFFLSIHESDRQKLFSTPAAAVALPSEEKSRMMGQVMMMMMTMLLSMILMTMMLSLIYSRCRVCGRSG